MADEKYNGWSNYATWRVNLELIDDYASSIAEDVATGDVEKWASVSDLADHLKQYVDDVIYGEFEDPSIKEERGLDLVRSYADAFLGDVDWLEIAEANSELIDQEGDDRDDT